MKITIRHAAALLRAAAGLPPDLGEYEINQDILNHEPPIMGVCGGKYRLTEHGQFVVAEMLNAMENAT
jgi:hypothetical protein